MIEFLLLYYLSALILDPGQDAAFIKAREAESQTSSCTAGVIAQAEGAYKRRKRNSQTLSLAEAVIKNLIKVCPDGIELAKFQKQLVIVEEESAQRHVYQAQFYLKGDGTGGIRGALYRLNLVYESYPHFSKRSEVTYLLAKLSRANGDEEDAKKYFRSVMSEFPRSKYAQMAREKLRIQ
jgi:outer membrane protein assembly factor BamD (BamD/ComL family)